MSGDELSADLERALAATQEAGESDLENRLRPSRLPRVHRSAAGP